MPNSPTNNYVLLGDDFQKVNNARISYSNERPTTVEIANQNIPIITAKDQVKAFFIDSFLVPNQNLLQEDSVSSQIQPSFAENQQCKLNEFDN